MVQHYMLTLQLSLPVINESGHQCCILSFIAFTVTDKPGKSGPGWFTYLEISSCWWLQAIKYCTLYQGMAIACNAYLWMSTADIVQHCVHIFDYIAAPVSMPEKLHHFWLSLVSKVIGVSGVTHCQRVVSLWRLREICTDVAALRNVFLMTPHRG